MKNSPMLDSHFCNAEIINPTETLNILKNLGINDNFAQQVALMLDCNTATVGEIVAMEADIIQSNKKIQENFKHNRTARNSILKAAYSENYLEAVNDEHYSEPTDDENYSEAA
ncbi:MAG: hypothetical protein GY828_07100 [Candidatus Gracilibacteria bacterium]|nr:hypothetical protein [Candidatus Gracilibacteria bacterium]